MSCTDYDTDDVSDDLSDMGSAESKPPISLKPTEFSLAKFAHKMGQANHSVFNEWKKVGAAGYLEQKHRSIFWGQTRLK